PEEAAEGIDRDLEIVGMPSRADEVVGGYSAGMRQRISICRAVLTRPPLLLLDEPDSNLDPDGRVAVRDLIGPAPGRTRVLVSHEPERALAEADAFLRLGPSGKVEEVGTP
ncbi:MAG: ATP-binding cassette domain-containing protein, partial [Solirubrobacterales bacterium]